jgi:DMSO/TMAO reductase YedYZ molybdopterin-dependent catalytic subunit
MQRRDLLRTGALAGMALLSERAFAQPATRGGELIPWSDQPPPVPPTATALRAMVPWEELNSWITPNGDFFNIVHYDVPTIDEKMWRLDVAGQVVKHMTLTFDELKALPRHEVTFTLECSGDNGFPFNPSLIGNARWAGASLAEVLRAAQIKHGALEVVFYGSDQGEEVVRQGTPLEFKFKSHFARSMSVEDAMNPANLLCYEMNGSPLPPANGFPVRLIAPGWFGIACVKWLTRVEVRDSRFLNRFMGRDYVTIREEKHGDTTIMAETSVGRILLKSAPARVVRRDGRYQIEGMAWGPKPIAAVEVKIDNGVWVRAKLDVSKSDYAWRPWSLDWSPAPGEHTVTSRAIDTAGNVQPAKDDPLIANKKTYWESNGQITRHVRIT